MPLNDRGFEFCHQLGAKLGHDVISENIGIMGGRSTLGIVTVSQCGHVWMQSRGSGTKPAGQPVRFGMVPVTFAIFPDVLCATRTLHLSLDFVPDIVIGSCLF